MRVPTPNKNLRIGRFSFTDVINYVTHKVIPEIVESITSGLQCQCKEKCIQFFTLTGRRIVSCLFLQNNMKLLKIFLTGYLLNLLIQPKNHCAGSTERRGPYPIFCGMNLVPIKQLKTIICLILSYSPNRL